MTSAARFPLIMLTLAAVTACGRSTPTAPAAAPAAPPADVAIQLRISGLPPSLQAGTTAQLTAQEVLKSGAVSDCAAASWSVNDGQIASVSPAGLLTARAAGYTTVIASCAGLTARSDARVETTVSYVLTVEPHDSALTRYGCVESTLEFLDGPVAGQRIAICSAPYLDPPALLPERYGGTFPLKVRITAEGYDSTDVVIAESTGTPSGTRASLTVPVPMTFVPDPVTDTFVSDVSFRHEIAYPFTLRAPGSVRVRNWWSLDYNDKIDVSLWCGGQRLQHAYEQRAAVNGGFTVDVPSAGPCEVKLQPDFNGSTLHRVAITYPR